MRFTILRDGYWAFHFTGPLTTDRLRRQTDGTTAATLGQFGLDAGPRGNGSGQSSYDHFGAGLWCEGMWVIEWSKDDTPLEALTELAPMQRELGLLRRAWEQNSGVARPLLAFRARAMSDRVLMLAVLG